MTEIMLFHHAQGLTPGIVAFADELRGAGHTVHTPDLFEGQTFDTIEAGLAHVREIGFETVLRRGVTAAGGMPVGSVYGGFSLGGMPAQQLAQTRDCAGALLFHTAITPEEFGGPWPTAVRVQIHAMDADPFFMEKGGDIDAARAIVESATDGELFLYAGDRHLFTDSSLPSYDVEATGLVLERVRAFLTA
jgi:dienelactone hydrolase